MKWTLADFLLVLGLLFVIAVSIIGVRGAEQGSGLKVIRERCLKCHSGDKPPNGLRLDSVDNMVRGGKSGLAVVPFKPEESLIFKMIVAGKMPPGEPLEVSDRENVRRWIAAGAMQHSMSGQEP